MRARGGEWQPLPTFLPPTLYSYLTPPTLPTTMPTQLLYILDWSISGVPDTCIQIQVLIMIIVVIQERIPCLPAVA